MKYKKIWMIGKDKKDDELPDYVDKYVAENGKVIECWHSFTSFADRWYMVDGHSFGTLKEAKAYVEGR